MPRSSTLPMDFADAFPVSMRFSVARGCSQDAGVSIRMRTCPPANSKKSSGCADRIRPCRMTPSCSSISMNGFAEEYFCSSQRISKSVVSRFPYQGHGGTTKEILQATASVHLRVLCVRGTHALSVHLPSCPPEEKLLKSQRV